MRRHVVHLGKDLFEYNVRTKKRREKISNLFNYIREHYYEPYAFRVKARNWKEAIKIARLIAAKRGETVIQVGLTPESTVRMFWWQV